MLCFFFFQAEDGIRYLVRSRGLGDVYKRQVLIQITDFRPQINGPIYRALLPKAGHQDWTRWKTCLLYTSDAADERSSVDLGGRRIIKKKTKNESRANRGI